MASPSPAARHTKMYPTIDGRSEASKGNKKGSNKKEEKVVDAEFEEVNKKNNKKSA